MKTVSRLNLMLLLLTVSEGGSSSVVGRTGQNVTLSCKYNIRYHGALAVCWGRGQIPSAGCSSQLISTDGQRVIEGTRASSRYQLLGRLDEGDVSLTILNVSEADAGRYGCRVDIPGWFNDDKHHFDVAIERGPAAQTTTSTTLNSEMSTQQTTANYTAGQVTSSESLPTSSPNIVKAEQHSSSVTVVLVFVLFGLVALVTAGGVVIIARRWRRLNKIPQQQQYNSTVQFNPTSSTLQLHRRGSAVENIYEIDGGGDGGEYEYCP